jgi:hypothetical protein
MRARVKKVKRVVPLYFLLFSLIYAFMVGKTCVCVFAEETEADDE